MVHPGGSAPPIPAAPPLPRAGTSRARPGIPGTDGPITETEPTMNPATLRRALAAALILSASLAAPCAIAEEKPSTPSKAADTLPPVELTLDKEGEKPRCSPADLPLPARAPPAGGGAPAPEPTHVSIPMPAEHEIRVNWPRRARSVGSADRLDHADRGTGLRLTAPGCWREIALPSGCHGIGQLHVGRAQAVEQVEARQGRRGLGRVRLEIQRRIASFRDHGLEHPARDEARHRLVLAHGAAQATILILGEQAVGDEGRLVGHRNILAGLILLTMRRGSATFTYVNRDGRELGTRRKKICRVRRLGMLPPCRLPDPSKLPAKLQPGGSLARKECMRQVMLSSQSVPKAV